MQKAIKPSNYAENLLQREFECYGPRMVSLTDITYILYNSVFVSNSSCFYKAGVSGCIKRISRSGFCKKTVEILVREHGVNLQKETIINNDQGNHYISIIFIKLLKDNGIRQSISRRAKCRDNAP